MLNRTPFVQLSTDPNNWLIHIPTPDYLVLQPLGTLVASYPLQRYYCTIWIHKIITIHCSSIVACYIVSTIIKWYILSALCCDPVIVYNKTIVLYRYCIQQNKQRKHMCRITPSILKNNPIPLVWCQWLACFAARVVASIVYATSSCHTKLFCIIAHVDNKEYWKQILANSDWQIIVPQLVALEDFLPDMCGPPQSLPLQWPAPKQIKQT